MRLSVGVANHRAVPTAMGITIRNGTIRAEADADFRGTLGIDRETPVGVTDVWFWQVSPNNAGDGYACRGNVDLGGMSTDITCYARCCRVPGL